MHFQRNIFNKPLRKRRVRAKELSESVCKDAKEKGTQGKRTEASSLEAAKRNVGAREEITTLLQYMSI